MHSPAAGLETSSSTSPRRPDLFRGRLATSDPSFSRRRRQTSAAPIHAQTVFRRRTTTPATYVSVAELSFSTSSDRPVGSAVAVETLMIIEEGDERGGRGAASLMESFEDEDRQRDDRQDRHEERRDGSFD